MDVLTCYPNPNNDWWLIKDDTTGEEYWPHRNDVPNTLFSLCNQKGYDKVWFEGPYMDSYEIMYKFRNLFPQSNIIFTVN